MFDKLSAPFPPEAIHWRAQQVYEKNGSHSALALAYLNARDVMDRLDDVAGPANWSTYYDETPTGRVLCKLSIRVNDEWITKTDGAGNTAVEAEKGGISDGLKRAAVQWGIGRYLYDLGNTYAPCEAYDTGRKTKSGKPIYGWRKWKPGADSVFADALARVSRPTGPINQTTQAWLANALSARNLNAGDLLKLLGPQDIRRITYEQMPVVKGWIEERVKEKEPA